MIDSQIKEKFAKEVRPIQSITLNFLSELRFEFEKRAHTTTTMDSNSLSDFFGWINTLLNQENFKE